VSRELDPHNDVLPVGEVYAAMMTLIRDSTLYVARIGKPAECGTCHQQKELRFGHCHACAMAARPTN
jgi:hypothetical protein